MPKRQTAAERSRKQTPAQKKAAEANLAKGRAEKQRQREEARERGDLPAGKRWAMVLDGTLLVSELDDEEVERHRVRGQDGGFTGRGPMLPSHIAAQFRAENIKRAQGLLEKAAVKATKKLLEIIDDPEAKHSDVIKAIGMVQDRGLGKTPETVHIKTEDPWGEMLGDSVEDVRDLG